MMRRLVFPAITAVAVAVGAPAAALAAGPAGAAQHRSAQAPFLVQASWPQFRDGVLHRGHSTTENVLSPSNVSGMDLDWSYTTGDIVISSPAVANGTVYVGSNDDNVYAFGLAGGMNNGTR